MQTRCYLLLSCSAPLPGQLHEAEPEAVVLDLLDLSTPDTRAMCQSIARKLAQWPVPPVIHIRVNPLDTPEIEADLDAVVGLKPRSIVLPFARGGIDVTHLAAKIAVREAENGLAHGQTLITAQAASTAQAMFGLGTFAGATQRLGALVWDVQALAQSLGVPSLFDAEGQYIPPLHHARSQFLFAAAAAGVPAIDTPSPVNLDDYALSQLCEAAWHDGFHAKMALNPAQASVIKAVFPQTRRPDHQAA